MKKSILIGMMALLGLNASAQKTEEKAVKQTVIAFAKAGDAQDSEKLATYLDDNYRIVMNRLFGGKAVAVMPKDVYLENIRTKKFGGDPRTLTFKEVMINGNTAMVRVDMKGSKSTMHSIILLAQTEAGNWLLVSDMPVL